jgi:hypothetical protein
MDLQNGLKWYLCTEVEVMSIFCFYGFLIPGLVEEIWILRKSVISNECLLLSRTPTFGQCNQGGPVWEQSAHISWPLGGHGHTKQQNVEWTTPSGQNENHQQEQRRAFTVEFARPNSKETVILASCCNLHVSLYRVPTIQ